MKLPRHGIVEIETLRRYGRVPIGTRAVGSFVLWAGTAPSGRRYEVLKTRIRVGGDPRVVSITIVGDHTSGGDRPRTWWTTHRGQRRKFRADDLSGYILKSVTHQLENRSTSTWAQHFKVVRIEWQDSVPLPAWVVEAMKRFGGGRFAEGT